jgi:polar amino acid transport system substrate-binding protein
MVALATAGAAARAGPDTALPERPLRVVVAGSVPFVVDLEHERGMSLEVWRAVAQRAGLAYALARASSVEDALEHVVTGRADVAVGPLSITAERARRVRFSQPYYRAGLGIMSRTALRPSQLIAPFFSPSFVTAAGLLLAILGLVGTLIWLAERRGSDSHFPQRAAPGIGNGIWFALVTMTTVGYGDSVPKTRMGRVIAAVWMLIAVVSLSSLTAGIASSLTLAKLQAGSVDSADELARRRVAAVAGSTGALFAAQLGAHVVEVAGLEAAVDLLDNGEAAAIVHDKPTLDYYLAEHAERALGVSPQIYRTTGYGFAVPIGSPLGPRLDSALLELAELGGIDDIARHWFGAP